MTAGPSRVFCFTGPMGIDRARVAPVVWLGIAGLVAVAVLFAPVVTGGWSADAPVGGTSMCGTFERSVLGIDTSIWLWLALSCAVTLATVLAVRRRRADRR
jgi:hypothetical protein